MLLNESYIRSLALEDGCMREWGPEKEELCWDGVQAMSAMEIRMERREQAGAASDNSRKDNKGEGVSCECSLRKSPPPFTTMGLLWTRCSLNPRTPS